MAVAHVQAALMIVRLLIREHINCLRRVSGHRSARIQRARQVARERADILVAFVAVHRPVNWNDKAARKERDRVLGLSG